MGRLFLLIFLVFSASHLVAMDLINEDFSGGCPPPGWVLAGINGGANWNQSYTGFAGGTSPEARFSWSPVHTGVQYLSGPQVNTQMFRDMEISIRYSLDHYANFGTYTVNLQVFEHGTTWNTCWSISGGADIPATLVTIPLDNSILDTSTFQFRFCFDGNSNDINFFYLDNVVLRAQTEYISGVWSAGTVHHVYCNLIVPDNVYLQIEQGVSVIFDGEYDIIVRGGIQADGTEAEPVTFEPATPGMNTVHIHIEGTQEIESHFSHCDFTGLSLAENDPQSIGGALLVDHAINLLVTNCSFHDNYAWYKGGAIALRGGSGISDVSISVELAQIIPDFGIAKGV